MPDLAMVRRAKLLTQEQLAEHAGVSIGTIYGIESGRALPRLSIIAKLSNVLGVDPNEVDEFRRSIERRPKEERKAS